MRKSFPTLTLTPKMKQTRKVRPISPAIQSLMADYEADKIGTRQIRSNLSLIREAANGGFPDVQAFLGRLHEDGVAARKDLRKAVFWHRVAAKNGQAYAQSWLGYAYATGTGVPKNLKTSHFWDVKAGRQGFAPAQYNL